MKNFAQESYEITITERIYTKVIHRQKKYRLKDEYNNTGKEVIITAKGPVKLKVSTALILHGVWRVISMSTICRWKDNVAKWKKLPFKLK